MGLFSSLRVPNAPDLSENVASEGFEARGRLVNSLSQLLDKAEQSQAARGFGSSASASELQNIFKGNRDAIGSLDAAIAAKLADAENEETLLQHQIDTEKANTRRKALGGLLTTALSFVPIPGASVLGKLGGLFAKKGVQEGTQNVFAKLFDDGSR